MGATLVFLELLSLSGTVVDGVPGLRPGFFFPNSFPKKLKGSTSGQKIGSESTPGATARDGVADPPRPISAPKMLSLVHFSPLQPISASQKSYKMLSLVHFRAHAHCLALSMCSQNAIPGTCFSTSANLNLYWNLQKSYKMLSLVHFCAHALFFTFIWSSQNLYEGFTWSVQKCYPWYTFYTFQEVVLTQRNFVKIIQHTIFLLISYKPILLVHFSAHAHMSTSLFDSNTTYKILIFSSHKCHERVGVGHIFKKNGTHSAAVCAPVSRSLTKTNGFAPKIV